MSSKQVVHHVSGHGPFDFAYSKGGNLSDFKRSLDDVMVKRQMRRMRTMTKERLEKEVVRLMGQLLALKKRCAALRKRTRSKR